MRQNHKLRIFFFLLFISLIFSIPSLGMEHENDEDGSTADGKYFKSPTTIRCHPPTLVTFYHEDEVVSGKDVSNGTYGETQLKRILKKYQMAKEGIKFYTTGNSSNHGFDNILVDESSRKIVFLEAKSTLLRTLLNKTKKALKKDDNNFLLCERKIGEGEVGYNPAISEEIVKKLNASLNTKPNHQLSRKWCSDNAEQIILVPSSPGEKDLSNSVQLKGILKNHIKSDEYKFMRVAALTIIDTEPKVRCVPSTTYYAIIRDGDSGEIASNDPQEKDRIVNAGLSFLLDKQEMSFEEARNYLQGLYHTLHKYRYPIELIDAQESFTKKTVMDIGRVDNPSSSTTVTANVTDEPPRKKAKTQITQTPPLNNLKSGEFQTPQNQKKSNLESPKKNSDTSSSSTKTQHVEPSNEPTTLPPQKMETSTENQPKSPRSQALSGVLKNFIKSEKDAGKIEALKAALSKCSKDGLHRELSSFFLLTLNGESLTQDFLNKAEENFKKRTSESYKKLNLKDLESKMREAMKSEDLGKFFQSEILPVFSKDRQGEKNDTAKDEKNK